MKSIVDTQMVEILKLCLGMDKEIVVYALWVAVSDTWSSFLVSRKDSPLRNNDRVSTFEATHCSKASALQTRFEAAAVSCDGLRRG